MDVTVDRLRLLRAGAGLAMVAALGLTACAPDDDTAAFDDSEPASAEDEAEESADEEEPDEEESDEEPESDADGEDDDAEREDEPDDEDDDGEDSAASTGPLDSEDAEETIIYESPGESSTTLEFGFHELRVIGDVMLLELSIKPEFSEGTSARGLFNLSGDQRISPQLTDRDNLKQYSVVGGGENTAPAGPIYESGQTAPYWAYFSAPVDDIDTITVSVIPGAVEFEDMEITWDDEGTDGDDE